MYKETISISWPQIKQTLVTGSIFTSLEDLRLLTGNNHLSFFTFSLYKFEKHPHLYYGGFDSNGVPDTFINLATLPIKDLLLSIDSQIIGCNLIWLVKFNQEIKKLIENNETALFLLVPGILRKRNTSNHIIRHLTIKPSSKSNVIIHHFSTFNWSTLDSLNLNKWPPKTKQSFLLTTEKSPIYSSLISLINQKIRKTKGNNYIPVLIYSLGQMHDDRFKVGKVIDMALKYNPWEVKKFLASNPWNHINEYKEANTKQKILLNTKSPFIILNNKTSVDKFLENLELE